MILRFFRAIGLITAIVLGAPCFAQPPPGIFFDDFYYATSELPARVNGTGARVDDAPGQTPLFGRNVWCTTPGLSGACSSSIQSRAWYNYLWREGMDFNLDLRKGRVVASADWPGTVAFEQGGAGVPYDTDGTQPQIASGLTATTGLWAASVDFSRLPDPGLANTGVSHIMQSFWTIAPFQVITSPSETDRLPAVQGGAGHSAARFEVDFEWNNWFGANPSQATSAGGNRFIATAIYENNSGVHDVPDGNTTPYYSLQETVWGGGRVSGHNRCRYKYAGDPSSHTWWRHGDVNDCSRLFADMDIAVPNLAPIYLFIRNDGERIRFELMSHGWGGVILMESEWTNPADLSLAPQEMMMMFSSYLYSPLGQGERMVVDWAYYSDDPDRHSNDVIGDVGWFRGNGHPRVNTTGLSLERPYRVETDPGPALSPIYPLSVNITSGPTTLSGGGQGAFTAQLSQRFTNFRVGWRTRAHTNNLGTLIDTPWVEFVETTGLRHTYTMTSARKVQCVQVEVRAALLDYHSEKAGSPSYDRIWYTETTDPQGIASATQWVCKPGFFPPPGGAGNGERQASGAEPGATSLVGLIPNPTTSDGVIRYTLAEAGEATVVVYDVLGREVARVAEGVTEAGTYAVPVNLSSLSAGLYVVRLRAGTTVLTQTFTVAR